MTERASIIVVDDNAALRKTLAMILERSGYTVDTAKDGVSAVDKFRDRHFDVALMDVNMPEMNGVQAFRKIMEINPEVRVILMTAYFDEEPTKMALTRALTEGVHCALYKPIDIVRVMELIREAD